MRRMIFIFGIIILIFVSTGCGLTKEEPRPKNLTSPNISLSEKKTLNNPVSNITSKAEADKKIEQLVKGILTNNSELVVVLMSPQAQ